MTEHDAYLALNLVSGIGPVRVDALVSAFGSAAEVFDQDREDLASVRGISMELAGKILEVKEAELEEELKKVELSGVRVLARCDEEFPSALADIDDAPLCLYVCGVLPDPDVSHSIAMVGSRRATPYGVRMARHLAESAVYSGWVVVSGLAAGIDAVSHESTLAAKGKTVAVLGGGLMNIQPREHVPMARRIVEQGGAILSEYPMAYAPNRRSFPRRNRIISALSLGTVVVEAGAHSGALITAAAALEQGKRIFAVPGNADSEMSAGCNTLIKSGEAALITDFEDVLKEMDFLPGMPTEPELPLLQEIGKEDSEEELSLLSDADRRILTFLRSGEAGFDRISAETGISASELSRKLVALEISHKIKRSPSGYTRLR